jgi:stress response protein SCP2
MSVQSIVLRRLNKILIPTPSIGSSKRLQPTVATFNLNLQTLGYTLSSKAVNALMHLSAPTGRKVMDDTLAALVEIKGVRNYKPMYPNFPQQVIEASDAELYINAIIHYFSSTLVDFTGDSSKIWLPKYTKDKREPLNEKVELRVLDLATDTEVHEIVARLATSNTSLSATDKDDLRSLIQNTYGQLESILPAIANKETLAFVGSILLNTSIDIAPYFKTATDILRLATTMSNGDVSLAEKTKFGNFNRPTRRYLLALLENIPNKEEDMLRWKSRWIRLGERLHPGDFSNRYPTTYKAFSSLRNNEHIETFNSKVEIAVRDGSMVLKAITLLSQRPGDFARRLDHLLRQASEHQSKPNVMLKRIVDAFLGVAHSVSTPVLLQVRAHFDNRQEAGLRVVFPKGNVSKVMALDKPLTSLPLKTTASIVEGIELVLAERFAILPKLGKVYIDPALKDCLLPFSQRSASKSLRTLVRGSKLPFGDKKNTLRFFIWWKDSPDDRVDLDLSAVLYDENWNHVNEVTFYNLRNESRLGGCYAVHSGDITSAPKGDSEFIDINIPAAIEDNVRYVVMSVHGFTSQNFCDLPECFAGFMLRNNPQSGEVYDPRTVEDKVDLTSAARDVIPMIIDLVDRKVIWVDSTMGLDDNYISHTVASSRGTIQLLGQAFANTKKPNLHDLLSLHAIARGTLVQNESKADVVFSVKDGTPFELDRIASEFMAN